LATHHEEHEEHEGESVVDRFFVIFVNFVVKSRSRILAALVNVSSYPPLI